MEAVPPSTDRDGFGDFLVQERVIADGELSLALAMRPHFGGSLSEALLGLGLLKKELLLDRRRHYTRRAVRNCRAACDQALTSLRDMPSLRQVRDLQGQLVLIEELLDTMPPLEPRSAAFRLDSQTIKTLLRSLEEAVLTTERLSQETSKLFAQQPSTQSWQQALDSCLRTTSRLSQLVRDRRTVR